MASGPLPLLSTGLQLNPERGSQICIRVMRIMVCRTLKVWRLSGPASTVPRPLPRAFAWPPSRRSSSTSMRQAHRPDGSTPLPGSDSLGDDRSHQIVDTNALVFSLLGQLGVKSARKTLTPLSSLHAGLGDLPARFPKHHQTVAKCLPPIPDRLFNRLPVRHAAGNVRILYQVAAALLLR